MRALLLAALLTCALGACTWVKMDPDGATVRVARAGENLASCSRKGEVVVSVRDKVGLYRRKDLKVREELETMARNEADSLAADTVQPVNEPSAGEQRFAAFACGSSYRPSRAATPTPRVDDTAPRQDEAETFPIRED